MHSYASEVIVFLDSVCSPAEMGRGRPLGSLDVLLSMAVLTASWLMLLIADLWQVWLSGFSARYCRMLGLNQPFRDRSRSVMLAKW